MANTNAAAPAPKRGFRWLRIAGFSLLGLLVLLVIAYFVLTSGFFFKSVILPKVSQAMNANVTVADASLGASGVTLQKFQVKTTGPEPLVTAETARVRYSFWDIIGGKITVDEILLQSPVVQIVYNPDGTSNLDPILKSQKKEAGPGAKQEPSRPSEPQKPTEPSKPGEPQKQAKPLQVNLKKLDLNNGTVRIIKNYENNLRDVTSVSGLNVSLQNVANGQTGKLTLAANLGLDNNPPAPGTNGLLLAAIAGDFSFALTSDLKPDWVKGNTKLNVEKAAGGFADASGLAAVLNCDATPTEIKDLALRFQKAGDSLGQVVVNGPFNMAQTEGRLNVNAALHRQLLNLVGSKSGMSFGQTAINSANQVALTSQGKVITLSGQFNVDNFSVTQTNKTTPTIDIKAGYNLTVDQPAKSALIKEFTVNGLQNKRQFLLTELTSPMKVSWDTNASPAGDATLTAKITGFDLADWKAFTGDAVSAGKLDATLKLISQQSGNLLNVDLTSDLQGLTAKAGTNQLTHLGANLMTKVTVTNLKKIGLNDVRAQLSQQGQTLLTATAAGTVNLQTTNTDLNVGVQGSMPRLAQLLPQTNLTASSGNIDLKARVLQEPGVQTITGNLALASFTGKMGTAQFDNYNTKVDLDLSVKGNLIEIRKVNGVLQAAGNPGGTFDLSGTYNTNNQAGQFSFKLANLNENALRPFLQPSLGDKKLVSVAVNGNANVNYNPQSDSTVKADFQLSNLVVNDPKNQIPATPLEGKLQLDSALNKKVLDLRNLALALTPTTRARNELQLTGKVDMTDTNAMQGNLKLVADALDLTTYYDLFSAKSTTAAPAPEKPAASAPEQKPAQGTAPATKPVPPAQPAPAPAQKPLPFRNFVVDANVGHLYLRAIDIAALQTSIKLNTNRVLIEPFQLTFNGAPVKSSVDLDVLVPGYQYAISLNADRLNVQPLIDTFMPDKKGLYKGEIFSNVKVQGVGSTGASLQKSLKGEVQFAFTNANIQIMDPLFQKYLGPLARFLKPVATFLNVPEIIDSPLQEITLNTQMGEGKIQMNTLNVASPLFVLNTTGTMPIANELTNSPLQNWPVNFYLARNVAQKIGLGSGTAPDAKMVKLPSFLSVGGTLGSPDPQINKMALAGTVLEKFGSKIPGLDGKAGNIIQGLGGYLSGRQAGATNQPAGTGTNQPATTNTGVGGLLRGLGGLVPSGTQTNQAAPSSTNKPAKPGIFDLFKR